MAKNSSRGSSRGPGRPRSLQAAKEVGFHSLPDGIADEYGLTPRQWKILEVIKKAVSERGFPPSIREICAASGLASPSSVMHQLQALENRGLIRRSANSPRAIEVLLPQELDSTDTNTLNPLNSQTVVAPILGRIAAGNPILAEEHVEDTFSLPKQIVGDGEIFLLEVKGDSMIDAAICSGDYVIVRSQPTADNGDIVAALLEDEATVKTFKKDAAGVWLLPHNPAYQPIDGRNARIMGKVVAVLRKV